MDKKNLQNKWDKQSKNNKIIIGSCTCCIGIILIIGIIGLITPENHNNTKKQHNYSNITIRLSINNIHNLL